MLNVNIEMTGLLPQDFPRVLQKTLENVDKSLEDLAYNTRDKMREIIKNNTYRGGSTGRLASAINTYPIENGWGIGKITELDVSAPYWRIINYGGYIPIAAQGRYIYGNFEGSRPDWTRAGSNPGAGTQKFIKGASPLYRMSPKWPISPKNYIEKTLNWVETQWETTAFLSRNIYSY